MSRTNSLSNYMQSFAKFIFIYGEEEEEAFFLNLHLVVYVELYNNNVVSWLSFLLHRRLLLFIPKFFFSLFFFFKKNNLKFSHVQCFWSQLVSSSRGEGKKKVSFLSLWNVMISSYE